MRYTDPTGEVPVDTVVDIISIGGTVYQVVRNPSIKNALWIGADIGLALVPYVPSSGSVRLIGRVTNADEAFNIAKGVGVGTSKRAFLTAEKFVNLAPSGRIDPIRIVEKDGMIFTLDNRRLKAFQDAGVNIPYKKLDSIPKRELNKFTTKNDGISIIVRQGSHQP